MTVFGSSIVRTSGLNTVKISSGMRQCLCWTFRRGYTRLFTHGQLSLLPMAKPRANPTQDFSIRGALGKCSSVTAPTVPWMTVLYSFVFCYKKNAAMWNSLVILYLRTHVSVPCLNLIPHIIPIIFTDLSRHITAPGIVPWTTTHRVPIIIHSIGYKYNDALTSSSGISLEQLER